MDSKKALFDFESCFALSNSKGILFKLLRIGLFFQNAKFVYGCVPVSRPDVTVLTHWA